MVALILARQRAPSTQDAHYDRGRNEFLFRLGCGLRWRGRKEAEIADTLRMVNTDVCHPPLPENEVNKIIRSVLASSTASPGRSGTSS
jgi:hypothetical protein